MSTLIPLEKIRVASPCRADWDKMEGDDRARFCQSCAKNVFNLSEMSKADAEKLIAEKEGNLCVRFYQRADGTIITDNCPVGLKIVRRPFKWLAAGFVAFLASGVAIASQGESNPAPKSQPTFDVRSLAIVRFVMDRFDGGTATMGAPAPVLGMMVCPTPTPTPTPETEE